MMSPPEPIFDLTQGRAPLIVSLPHVGTQIPVALRSSFLPRALAVEDTDWYLSRLYDFVVDMGASLLIPYFSRYVIDLNRPPDNSPMYSQANNTELCPTHSFSGGTLYRAGRKPDEACVKARLDEYWLPYHNCLERELQRQKVLYGHAVVLDGHSISAELPWLFSGRLPDLNLGTFGGRSCSSTLRSALGKVLDEQTDYTSVIDGRFQGGYITRNYGRPNVGIHAIQIEMSRHCYMIDKAPFSYDKTRAARVCHVLRALVQAVLDWRPSAS